MNPRGVAGRLGWNSRIAVVALHDVAMAALAFELALYIRYSLDGTPPAPFAQWESTVLFTGLAAAVFSALGLYRGIWHYASFRDLVGIVKAVSLTLLLFLPALFLLTRLADLPRSAVLIVWPLLVVLLTGPRLLYRAWKDGNIRSAFERRPDSRVPVLLVGAGQAAEMFIRDMARSRDAGYRVVGLVDDKASRLGRDIHGVRVLGGTAAIASVVDDLARAGRRPHRLILSTEQLDGATVRRLLDSAEGLGLTLARLPRLTDFRAGGEAAPDIRPIDVEDLLGRPQKVLDRAAMQRFIAGRRVLITGAGGTIGAELARQIADLAPATVILFENGEHNLYQIDLELAETRPQVDRRSVLADVRDGAALDEVFRRERPELVFHAAAFKHVPLAETNPTEAVLTNAIGTRRVVDACVAHGVVAMVLVSTDKAVNPTSVMGASKRVAELICQAQSVAQARRPAGPRFITVRFGNVLGSTGSVVPLFQRQLVRGGPLTVTHPDMTRFFMTTREAVALILRAATLGEADPGKIFVLDMGEPVRILDMARQMIRLAGWRPERDVAIEFTGVRPGEKLHEELLHLGERLVATSQEGILLAAPRLADLRELNPLLDQMADAAQSRDTLRAMTVLNRLVPEFHGGETARQAAAGA